MLLRRILFLCCWPACVRGPTVLSRMSPLGVHPAAPVDKPAQIGCSRKLDKKYVTREIEKGGIDVVSLNFTSLLLAPVIPPGLVTFLPFMLIIAVFYLMLVRPNQKKQKQWQEMLEV